MMQNPSLKSVTRSNFREHPRLAKLPAKTLDDIELISRVLPFKTNNYVLDELIDWNNWRDDPLFLLNFPCREMLSESNVSLLEKARMDNEELKKSIQSIRNSLNPHPAGQLEHNIPSLEDGTLLPGVQHKYDHTALFFPSHGQTCHAYCTFCFRWAQFVGKDQVKIAMKEIELFVRYLREHPEITDILFTGGDPMVMNSRTWNAYLEPILRAKLPNLRTIRIGSKSLSFWPYKFLDQESEEFLASFRRITESGLNLAFMAHINHGRELETDAARSAIQRILSSGAQIRSQSPLLKGINDTPETWVAMWRQQVSLGIMPYYMFVARDTGPKNFFEVPLIHALHIYQKAISGVSGLGRTARGPIMSTLPGKVNLLGTAIIDDREVFCLSFIQARKSEWIGKPFFARLESKATWFSDLKPAFGSEKFFFEGSLERLLNKSAIAHSRDRKLPPSRRG